MSAVPELVRKRHEQERMRPASTFPRQRGTRANRPNVRQIQESVPKLSEPKPLLVLSTYSRSQLGKEDICSQALADMVKPWTTGL